GHADLLADAFLASFKDEIIRGSLQSGTFPVRQSSGLGPMVNMRAAAAASGHSIRRLFRIEPLINLADFCSHDIQLQMLRKVSCKSVLTGLDIAKTLHYSRRLLCAIIVGGIFRDRRYLNGGTACVI